MNKRQKGLLAFLLRKPEASISLVGIILLIVFQFASPVFFTGPNLQTVSQFFAPWALIACGEIMLLICGEVDLSVGQVFALTPFIMYFVAGAGVPLFLAMILALLVAGLLGLCIGFITVHFGVPSFITTLGAMLLINGLTLTISGGFPVDTPNNLLGNIFGGWAYSEIAWAVGVAVVMHTILRHTRWGLQTIAAGGNPTGAAEAGIRIKHIKIGNFILCSTIGGLAGILNAFHVTSIDPNAGGANVMFLAIASSVIGGTSLMGGSGTILGGLVGAAVLGILQDGFTLLGINAYTFDIITGAAILITMISNVQFAAWRRRSRI
ncbi:ABC transporter permease [Acidocella sp.]|uniref:ABC transporter permease n=1 Tax=Acidocella sp. TaxID=50710 RepID=UPI00261D425D|nr:ABC transporter permease [Acidocella sp.]